MASLKLSTIILSILIFFNAADHDSRSEEVEDVAVKVTEASDILETGEKINKKHESKKMSEKGANTEKAWEGNRRESIDHNLDGLILLACIVGLILFIILLRYVCCTIEQCEEKSKRSPATTDTQYKVEQTQREHVLQGVKYKSLVWIVSLPDLQYLCG